MASGEDTSMGSKATPPLARTGEAGAKRPRLMGSDGEMLDVPDDDADEEERAATFELEAAGSPSPRKRTSKAPPSSPRVQRLEVREQKKASVKCASTLDFTALSVKRPPHTRAPAHYHRSTTDDVLESLRRVTRGCFATAKMAARPSEHMAGTAKMVARPREHMARRAWPWLIGQQSRCESARS